MPPRTPDPEMTILAARVAALEDSVAGLAAELAALAASIPEHVVYWVNTPDDPATGQPADATEPPLLPVASDAGGEVTS